MVKTLGIIAIKGGVGKTTISSSLAENLANEYNKKVLLIDTNFSAPNLGLHMDLVDPEKTIHHVLDNKINLKNAIHKKFNVDIIPGSYIYNSELNHLKLKEKIKTIKKLYDYVILDSSPSLNNEILSTMLASDLLFVVSTPDYPTLSCSLKAAKLAKQRGKPIAGIILNKIRNPKFELSLEDIEQATDIPVVAKIPDDKNAIPALFNKMPISHYHKKSPFSKEIDNISAALTFNKEKSSLFSTIFRLNHKKEKVNRELLKDSFYKSVFKD